MEEPESIQLMAEEIRILRRTVQRFGTYFVVLTVLPVIWGALALLVLGYFPTLSSSVRTVAKSTTLQDTSSLEAKIIEQEDTISALGRMISSMRQEMEAKEKINSRLLAPQTRRYQPLPSAVPDPAQIKRALPVK